MFYQAARGEFSTIGETCIVIPLLGQRLFGSTLGLSALLHLALVCWLARVDLVEPREVSPRMGHASISMRASLAAAPRKADPSQASSSPPAPAFELPFAPDGLLPQPLEPQPSAPRLEPQPPAPKDETPPQPDPKPKVDKPSRTEPTSAPMRKEGDAAKDSPSSRASDGARVAMPSETTTNPAPPYPPEALAAGLQGTVTLRVKIDATGKVLQASVYESSGIASFDDSALRTIRRWVFHPARRNGVAVPYEFTKDFEFYIRRG